MNSSAKDILNNLSIPGHTLAFCDETDFTQGATSTMVANIHAWVALIIPSDIYAAISAEALSYQNKNSLPELHGNEIVTPGSASPWKGIALDNRLAAYKFACDLVTAHASQVRYVHISKAQYDAEIVASATSLPKGYKKAVKDVFKASIIEHLSAWTKAALIFDKDKNNHGPTLEKVAGSTHLIGGGVLRASSHDVPGLQLADITAYAVGRYLRRRDTIIANGGNEFDAIAMELVGSLDGRFSSLLGPKKS